MRWIGGGIDPFHDNGALEGEGFSKQIMGRGESGLQASVGAHTSRKNGKVANENAIKDRAIQERQAAAFEKVAEKMNGDLMGPGAKSDVSGGGQKKK